MTKLQDVARLAGVSPSTVSRSMARPELVAEATRERVMQAVSRVGYQPNEIARSLRQQGSRNLGLVVTDLLNPFHATLAKGVQDAADRFDLNVILFNSDESALKERRALETLRGHLPQGVILVPTAHTRQHQALLSGLTVVELDRSSGLPGAHSVQVDNFSSAREAVAHLTQLGHRRIGMIAGRSDVNTSQERLGGYRSALASAGLPYREAWVRSGDDREAEGYRAAHELLRLPKGQRPSALFVGNHEMTVGSVLAARALNLSIPGDLSLIGFDDSRLMQILEPPISVVAQPTYDLGYAACQTLLAVLKGAANAPPMQLRLRAQLVHRSSTAPPRSS